MGLIKWFAGSGSHFPDRLGDYSAPKVNKMLERNQSTSKCGAFPGVTVGHCKLPLKPMLLCHNYLVSAIEGPQPVSQTEICWFSKLSGLKERSTSAHSFPFSNTWSCHSPSLVPAVTTVKSDSTGSQACFCVGRIPEPLTKNLTVIINPPHIYIVTFFEQLKMISPFLTVSSESL